MRCLGHSPSSLRHLTGFGIRVLGCSPIEYNSRCARPRLYWFPLRDYVVSLVPRGTASVGAGLTISASLIASDARGRPAPGREGCWAFGRVGWRLISMACSWISMSVLAARSAAWTVSHHSAPNGASDLGSCFSRSVMLAWISCQSAYCCLMERISSDFHCRFHWSEMECCSNPRSCNSLAMAWLGVIESTYLD